MKEYIVSARKYRPMTFDTVVGQSALTTTLKNAVKSGKLAHAYLFCGPRGVGKTTCARIFAKAINCEHPTESGEACNNCESCQSFNEQRSYNIFELDAASNNGVEHIKTLMEQTRIPPQMGKYKVFIIDEVHMLSTAAFNAFLKTLEEPPAHVIFILATTEKHKILPTIISRCQIYDFERMTVSNIVGYLKEVAEKEGVTYEEEALNVIAEKADGGMRDALSIFDQAASFCQGNITYEKVLDDLNVLDSENYFNIIDLALENKVAETMVLLNDVIAKGFDGGHLIGGLAKHVRNVLMAKDDSTLSLLEVSDQQRQRYKEQAAKCPALFLYKALKLMNQCDINYRQSSNKRLLVELTLIQVAQITQEEDTPVAGRSPKRLKSLFQRTLTQQVPQNETAKQVAVAEPVVPKTEPTEPTAPKAPTAKRQSLSAMGFSFSSLKKRHESTVTSDDSDEIKITATDEGSAPFTQIELKTEWNNMLNRMPQSMVGLVARLKNITPKLLDYPNVEVVVDNQILLNQLKQIQGRVRATLANDLKEPNLTLSLRLTQGSEVRKTLSKKELFEKMRKNNPAVEKLRESLDLILS
ncbi:MAG: DNA polymerase III subunit gamma/tau [Prevotella sp.]|nr:DNA polymerase III subunit gamma/tau [Prevotella sp.]